MYKQFYAGMSYEYLPLFALLLFMAVFIGTALRLFLRRASDYDPVSRIPLSDPKETTTSLLTSASPDSPAAGTEGVNHG